MQIKWETIVKDLNYWTVRSKDGRFEITITQGRWTGRKYGKDGYESCGFLYDHTLQKDIKDIGSSWGYKSSDVADLKRFAEESI